MAESASTGSAVGRGTARSARRPPMPGRRQLLGAVAMVGIGSFLPWVHTPVGNLNGLAWGGLWTFYASMLGLAGVLVPSRRLALVQAALFAAAAIVLPLVQVGQLVSLVGVDGWRPGPGLVLVLGGGVLAVVAVRRMLTHERPASGADGP